MLRDSHQRVLSFCGIWSLGIAVTASLLLAGCESKELPTEELRALKPACAGGDAATCADIGHKIRADRAEAAYAAAPS